MHEKHKNVFTHEWREFQKRSLWTACNRYVWQLMSSDAEFYDAVARGARVIASAGILSDRERDQGERVGLIGAAADATAMNERSLDPYTWSRTLENWRKDQLCCGRRTRPTRICICIDPIFPSCYVRQRCNSAQTCTFSHSLLDKTYKCRYHISCDKVFSRDGLCEEKRKKNSEENEVKYVWIFP